MSHVIEIENVSKRFRSQVAMDNVNLQVPRGVVFALLGENGAGKTTTIRTLLGLETPDKGSIRVLNMDPRKQAVSIREQIGYVSESPALYDWMTVRKIGWFTSGFYPEPFQTSFERLAAEFDLPLNKKIKSLSKGGRAKVALALAMAHNPQLLILDEPTSGLDTLVRRKFLESMVDVAASGRTVLLSSHQIPEVERVTDHVAIVNNGRILVCQPLEQLKQQVERWIVTFESATAQLPAIAGKILLAEGQGTRRRQFTVRNPGNDDIWKLRDNPAIVEVEVHTPSLEDIFVAFMKADQIGLQSGLQTDRVTGSGPRTQGPEPQAHEVKKDGGLS